MLVASHPNSVPSYTKRDERSNLGCSITRTVWFIESNLYCWDSNTNEATMQWERKGLHTEFRSENFLGNVGSEKETGE